MRTSTGTSASPVRVLVVEDDRDIQGLLSRVLLDEGCDVCVKARLEDVRALFQTAPPDVVLLDGHLPDGYGLDLLPELRREWPAIGVVMMSGSGTPGLAAAALERGAGAFLDKPFDLEELRLAVREACERRTRTPQLAESSEALPPPSAMAYALAAN